MTAIVPSYLAKVARAKEHLVDLNAEIERYAAQSPYGVSEGVEGKKKPRKVRRLTFTADPANTDIAIIAADVIYNLRSSLDHLMSALVAKKDRGSAMFPIFFEGVWEPVVPGENEQRIKERGRWASYVKTVKGGAVAVLMGLQPPDGAPDDTDANLLELINRLSNRDRHEKLPVIAAGMTDMFVRFKLADGTPKLAKAVADPYSVLKDKAEIKDIPEDAVDVEIQGVPLVAIHLAHKDRFVPLPAKLDGAARLIAERVIPNLAPYVRTDGG
jgi:hypothetical protein